MTLNLFETVRSKSFRRLRASQGSTRLGAYIPQCGEHFMNPINMQKPSQVFVILTGRKKSHKSHQRQRGYCNTMTNRTNTDCNCGERSATAQNIPSLVSKYLCLFNSVGKFCMKLWRKLVKVYADLQTISQMLHEYNFVSRSVEYLIEALQEQVEYRVRCRSNTPMISKTYRSCTHLVYYYLYIKSFILLFHYIHSIYLYTYIFKIYQFSVYPTYWYISIDALYGCKSRFRSSQRNRLLAQQEKKSITPHFPHSRTWAGLD